MFVLQSSEKQKQGWNYLHYDFIRRNACDGKWRGTERKKVRDSLGHDGSLTPGQGEKRGRSLGGCTLDLWVVQLSLNIQATYSERVCPVIASLWL